MDAQDYNPFWFMSRLTDPDSKLIRARNDVVFYRLGSSEYLVLRTFGQSGMRTVYYGESITEAGLRYEAHCKDQDQRNQG